MGAQVTFTVPKKQKFTIVSGIVSFVFLAILGFSLPVIDPSGGSLYWAIIGGTGFGVGAIYLILLVPRAFRRITLIKEGIETSLLGAKRMIQWQDIKGVRYRNFLHRLDLIGPNGKTILKIDYQIDDFNIIDKAIRKNLNL